MRYDAVQSSHPEFFDASPRTIKAFRRRTTAGAVGRDPDIGRRSIAPPDRTLR